MVEPRRTEFVTANEMKGTKKIMKDRLRNFLTPLSIFSAALLCAGPVLFLAACKSTTATTSTSTSTNQQAEAEAQLKEVQFACYSAASLGTAYAIAKHPEWRPEFEAGLAALDALIAQNNFDPAAFHQALLKLPIKELKSGEAALAIQAATILFHHYGAEIALDQQTYVGAVIASVRRGIWDALGASTNQP